MWGWPVADFSGRDLAWLERRRAELLALISQVGDFRRGALNAVWRKCGKPNCACAQPGHRGHGPQWNLTRRVGGRTVNVHLKPGPELEKVQREVAEHQRFADLVEEVSQVSEAICASRPARAGTAPPPAEGKGGARGAARGGRRRRGRPAGRPGRGHAGTGAAAGRFRRLGMLTGSGHIAAACKQVVAQRAKHSGMHWTVQGAASIIALRTQHASGRWDELWAPSATQPAVLRSAI
jgi:hypothetical protein